MDRIEHTKTDTKGRKKRVDTRNRLRGKESIEVRISQKKGKESENSYQKYFW
jgi:hypothetical protein